MTTSVPHHIEATRLIDWFRYDEEHWSVIDEGKENGFRIAHVTLIKVQKLNFKSSLILKLLMDKHSKSFLSYILTRDFKVSVLTIIQR